MDEMERWKKCAQAWSKQAVKYGTRIEKLEELLRETVRHWENYSLIANHEKPPRGWINKVRKAIGKG